MAELTLVSPATLLQPLVGGAPEQLRSEVVRAVNSTQVFEARMFSHYGFCPAL